MKNVLLQAVAVVAVTLCMTSHVLAQVVESVDPGTTARFDLPDDSFSSGCVNDQLTFCETEVDGTGGTMGSYVVTSLTKTKSFIKINTLTKQFTVPADGHAGNVVNARITGSAVWRGTLATVDWSQLTPAQFGNLGTRADALLRTSLLDVTDPNNEFEVGNAAIADFSCEPDRTLGVNVPLPLTSDGVDVEFAVGLCEEERADTFSYGAKLIRGHTYEMQLAVTTQATTGWPTTPFTLIFPITLAASTFYSSPLAFSSDVILDEIDIPDIDLGTIDEDLGGILPLEILPSIGVLDLDKVEIPKIKLDLKIPTGPIEDAVKEVLEFILPEVEDGFVEWDYFTVTIDEDIEAQISEVVAQASDLADQIAEIREGVVDNIRLLNTPQGQRTSNYPGACGDGCDWPEK